MFNKLKNSAGQSLIEVIVAVSIFVIIASTSVIAMLGSFSSTRLAKEETQASFFAQEGLEAVQSIRNQGWDEPFLATDCSAGCGLTKTGNIWNFSGESDDPDKTAKFSRTVTVENVERSQGDLVDSDGTIDEDTKKITVAVSWNFTPMRTNTITLTSYLTNWQKGKNVGGAGAPILTSCHEYCLTAGYSAGTCRENLTQCDINSEDYRPAGDLYCTGGPSADTCCCLP